VCSLPQVDRCEVCDLPPDGDSSTVEVGADEGLVVVHVLAVRTPPRQEDRGLPGIEGAEGGPDSHVGDDEIGLGLGC